jgi:hypothetical protein
MLLERSENTNGTIPLHSDRCSERSSISAVPAPARVAPESPLQPLDQRTLLELQLLFQR